MEQEIQVKIDSYILKLKNNLNKLPEEEQIDVINEVKSHIFESISYSDNSNKKLEEVLKSLGKPKDYANLITQEYMSKLVKKGSFKEQFKMFILNMRAPFSITLFIYLFILQANTVVLYKDSIDRITLSELISINLLSLPALIELMIPISILY
ncbi:MAG: HAAS signaling domain-containing protein, partial [Candidatus Sericytochromatia bacterium]